MIWRKSMVFAVS